MDLNIIYWNAEGKDTTEQVLTTLFQTREIDILIIGECPNLLSDKFLTSNRLSEFILNTTEKAYLKARVYYTTQKNLSLKHITNIDGNEERITVIEDKGDEIIYTKTIKKLTRVIILEVCETEIKNPFLLCCLHFPSKKNLDEISQLQTAYNYKRYIQEFSASCLDRVIIVGDFNMNPFDLGMVEPHGFFAINNLAFVKQDKQFQYATEMMYYNPCWWHLGDYYYDSGVKTSGTHYYESAPSKKLFWHLFDQVIFSKAMADTLIKKSLDLIQVQDIINELVQIKPTRKNALFSDHLPISFTIKLS